LADVLLHDPAVLILDEPTVGLDPTQIRETRHLIRSLAGEHTVLLSTHILPEVEQTCDSLLMIAGGKLVARGTLDELTNASETEGSLEDFFVQATYQQNMEKENAG
jgi:ABC-2 type transport system ATP-binding protein